MSRPSGSPLDRRAPQGGSTVIPCTAELFTSWALRQRLTDQAPSGQVLTEGFRRAFGARRQAAALGTFERFFRFRGQHLCRDLNLVPGPCSCHVTADELLVLARRVAPS